MDESPATELLEGPILITGGSGMLGSALLETLRSRGDVLAPTHLELDLLDATRVGRFIREHQPRTVFHLVGFVRGILGNQQAGITALVLNARIQTNLLESMLPFPPKSIVVAGTVAAYAYPYKSLPLKEEDFWAGSPHGAEGFYAAGKRVAVPWLEALNQLGANTVFAILTNLFGPRDHFGEEGAHVVPSLLARFTHAVQSKADTIRIWGRPDTTRDFLFSFDAARYLVDLAAKRPGAGHRNINVASGVETSIQDLCALLAGITGFSGELSWDRDAPVGVLHRSVDVRMLKSLSAHEPTDLAQALHTTYESYK